VTVQTVQPTSSPQPGRGRRLARFRRRPGRRTAPRAGYRALFRNRDYRLLFAGLVISNTGSWAYSVALVVYVFDITHSAGWVAAASVSRFLSALIASPFGGLLADRTERVRLMVNLNLLALVVQALLAVVAALNGAVVLGLALVVLTSVVGRVYEPADRATLPAVVGEDLLAAANSMQSVVENLTIVLGPAIGALLTLLGPPAITFAVNAASFGVAAVLVARVSVRSRPGDISEGGGAGALRQMAAGFQAFFGSPTVVLLGGFSILATFVYGTDTVLFVVISKQLLGTGSSGYGYLLGASGVGAMVMAAFMNRVAGARRLAPIIVAGMAVYCLPTSLLPLVHSPGIAVVLQVVRGAGTIVVDVLAITAMQRFVPSAVVARVFGVFFALALGALSLGALLTPILLGTLGLDTTLLVMGLAIPVLALATYPWIARLDARARGELAHIEPRVVMLRGFDIFAGTPRGALEALARGAVQETVGAGVVMIPEGAQADDFFVLTAGEADVRARGPGAEERHLATLTAPDYFGEIGLLERRPRTATVTASSPCTVLRIKGGDFLAAVTAVPLTPGALGLAQARLERTEPAATLTLAGFGAEGR
jgi:MFS family permease